MENKDYNLGLEILKYLCIQAVISDSLALKAGKKLEDVFAPFKN